MVIKAQSYSGKKYCFLVDVIMNVVSLKETAFVRMLGAIISALGKVFRL